MYFIFLSDGGAPKCRGARKKTYIPPPSLDRTYSTWFWTLLAKLQFLHFFLQSRKILL